MSRSSFLVTCVVASAFTLGCSAPASTDSEGSSESALAAAPDESTSPASRKLVADGKWSISYPGVDENGLMTFEERAGGTDHPSLSAAALPTLAEVIRKRNVGIPNVVVAFDPPQASAGGGGARTIEASASCDPTIRRDTRTWQFEVVRCRVNGNDEHGVWWSIQLAFDDDGRVDNFEVLGGTLTGSDGRWAGHVSFGTDP